MTTRDGRMSHWLYSRWSGMIDRCTSPKNRQWHNYGGRGITVCEQWRTDFWAYVAHIESLPCPSPDHFTVDRVDNDLGYAPGNVRWATYAMQLANRRPPVRRSAPRSTPLAAVAISRSSDAAGPFNDWSKVDASMAPTTSGRRNPLVRRALAAYFGQRTSEIWPYTGHVRVVADAGGTERTYVVLVGAADDVLAVYRVHNDGQLKLLSRRWPPRPAPPPPKPPAQPGPDTPTEGTTP